MGGKASGNSASAGGTTGSQGNDAAQTFLDYMKELPAQRLEDSWLAAHHLTAKELAAMSPDQRKAIEQQMAADIKEQIKQATDKKPGGNINMLV